MSTWALIGSPNSGKTTLYNWLTGSKSKTVNYPGSTVEYNLGALRSALSDKFDGADIRFVDTPGIYSLNPKSDDEVVTRDVLFNTQKRIEKINGVIVVLDATQLSRHLYIAKQIIDSGYPAIFVITMWDLIEKEESVIDLGLFKTELNSNVVLFDGVMGRGLNELIKEIVNFKNVENFNATNVKPPDWSIEKQSQVILWAETLAAKTIIHKNMKKSASDLTRKLDQFLMHPIFGFVLFFSIMTLLFSSIYWAAAPFMDFIDSQFGALAEYATENIGGLAGEFIGNGLIAGIGGVVIFVPQIFILSFGIGFLEATGYLARVAALVDKPLSMVGLGGRSFVPLLSGFACSIPAIMATRNISSKKERLIAQSIIPFMTCSARLPVYALLISFLYGTDQPFVAGMVLTALYFGAIVVGAIAAHVISLFIKDRTPSRLLMELPLYRRPRFTILLMQALSKSKVFLTKAGPIILILSAVLWFGTNFPREEVEAGKEATATEIAQGSYAAHIGKAIEPIFKPMGVDWRVGFGLISAFAAREVFVSAMALTFNIESNEEEAQTEGLLEAMSKASFPDGTPIFTTATVVGLFLFFMIALQCTSTVGILRREMGSWKPALLQLFLSNFVAYNVAVVAVNFLRFLGF
jgi:ferrous iron transport protein B